MSMWLITLLVVLSVVVGTTLAYLFSSDFASKFVGMSGAVKIEAVGKGTKYDSIEDTKTTFLSNDMFSGESSNWKIYVPDSAVGDYRVATNLAQYADRIYPVSERP